MKAVTVTAALALSASGSAQRVRTDPGTYGPPLEIAHLFYDEWPTGIAVSSTGRKFANYPGGLDANDTYAPADGQANKYTVGELFSNNTEAPYPSAEINHPPGGAINRTTSPPTGANYQDRFVGVQSVVIDSADRLWVLDTGRVIDPTSKMLLSAAPGGPKLVGVNLTTNKVFKTIVFPPTVVFPDSYLNDVRFDLRSNLSGVSGKGGVAYITDSSSEGRNGLVVADLETGESWRHLSNDPRTHPEQQVLPFVWGESVYGQPMPDSPFTWIGFGADGIALGADGDTLYWSAVQSRRLYSVPTAALREHAAPQSEVMAQAAVNSVTEKGVSDGLETDSNGLIYAGNVEQEGIVTFNPKNGTVQTFVRDPRVNWVDTMSVATDGYLYFTVNQLNFGPLIYPGTDRRQRPFVLFRAKLPGNGTKANPGGPLKYTPANATVQAPRFRSA